jgi:hypothetical protein
VHARSDTLPQVATGGGAEREALRRTDVEEIVKFLLVVMLLAASQPPVEIYTWKDSRGIQHYGNRKDDIPVRYRDAAKSLDYDQGSHAVGLPLPAEEKPRVEKRDVIKRVKERRPVRNSE